MVRLEVSGLGRVALDVVLGLQQGRLADLQAFGRIRNLVKPTEAERASFRSPDGRAEDMEAIRLLSPISFDIENDEARRLKSLLENWDGFRTGDLEWMEPLLAQLKEK